MGGVGDDLLSPGVIGGMHKYKLQIKPRYGAWALLITERQQFIVFADDLQRGEGAHAFTPRVHIFVEILSCCCIWGNSFVKSYMRVVMKGRLFGDQPLTIHGGGACGII